MGCHVEIESTRAGGFRGYEARSNDGDRAGWVLVVHEWFGLNASTRAQTDRLAARGFHALAVDLYQGKVAGDAASAQRLAAELRAAHAMRVIGTAIEYARSHPDGTGKVALVGFCLGGAVALAAASCLEGVSAAVTFCGLSPRTTDVSRIRATVMGHYGERDPLMPIARPRALFDALLAAGKRARLHTYRAGHAFMRVDSQSYRAAVAELAWQRTRTLLREELSET